MKTDLDKAKDALKQINLFVASKEKTGKTEFKKGERDPLLDLHSVKGVELFLKSERDFEEWEKEHFETLTDGNLSEEQLRERAEVYKATLVVMDKLRELMQDRPYTGVG